MDDSWAWAEPIRDRHFGPALLGRYAMEPVSEGEYWSRWVPMWRPHWPPEVYFDFEQLCDEQERARRERVVASEGGQRLTEHWVAREGDEPVALFSGRQQSGAAYLMTHAQVHPDHQGRGIYTEIVRREFSYPLRRRCDQLEGGLARRFGQHLEAGRRLRHHRDPGHRPLHDRQRPAAADQLGNLLRHPLAEPDPHRQVGGERLDHYPALRNWSRKRSMPAKPLSIRGVVSVASP
jgi:GNAT superfamily N-acetyltransferase